MSSPRTPAGADAVQLLALAVVSSNRLLLVAPGADRWQREMGCTLVPLELPGCALSDGEPLEDAVTELGRRWLGVSVHVCSSRWVYTPSDRHAIDRRAPSANERPAPLVLLARMTPDVDTGVGGLRPVIVRILSAVCDDEPSIGPQGSALFELPIALARQVVRGAPLAQILAAGSRHLLAAGVELPEDTVLYLPSEYGERYLLRAVAKYGEGAMDAGVRAGLSALVDGPEADGGASVRVSNVSDGAGNSGK